MLPKIADFGLSKCFHEKQSQTVTSKLCGSIGYFAPESYSGRITFKSDIYSLGVIIIEILTGEKGYVELEDVLEMWKNRLKKSHGDTHLLEQVKICAVIGMECIECNPRKRPDTQQIIDRLHEVESTIRCIEVGMSNSLAAQVDNTSNDELHQGTPEERGQTNSCEMSKIRELKTTKAEIMDGLHEIGMSSLGAHIDNASSDELHEGTPKERGQTNTHKMSKIPELKTTKRGLYLSRFKCWCSHLYCTSFPYTISIQKRSKSKLAVSAANYISLETLRAATQGFSGNRRIRSGSFGSVYHFTLPDGREVAIKRAENKDKIGVLTTYHETAFNSEVAALTQARHKNVMCLLGCCSESGERVLVHDFMTNGSLYDQLHGGSPMAPALMSWRGRFSVALDSARGIEYMHVYTKRLTIHRNIKSANILFDNSWTAKIADFGHSLALKGSNPLHPLSTGGTPGYMDPEYYQLQTDKNDVYSFGVVLLELLSGCRVVQQHECKNIVELLVPRILADDVVRVLDPRLPAPTPHEWEALAYVGYLAADCVSPVGVDRPSMTEVVDALERALTVSTETTVPDVSTGTPATGTEAE